jgi:hypothetical protein
MSNESGRLARKVIPPAEDPGPYRDAQELLMRFLVASGAQIALVIDPAGRVLVAAGDPGNLDPTGFASVCAAHFEANLQLASLVGEPEFRTLLHQGEHSSIYLAGVAGSVLAVVYEGTRRLEEIGPIGNSIAIRLESPIRDLISDNAGDGKVKSLDPDWVHAVESEIERVFSEGV